jgi:hypothetical protein
VIVGEDGLRLRDMGTREERPAADPEGAAGAALALLRATDRRRGER